MGQSSIPTQVPARSALCIFDFVLNGFYVFLLFTSQIPKVYVFPYIRFFQEMLRLGVKFKQAVSL